MSYSFSITAANPTEAKVKLAVQLATVVSGQVPHARELPAVYPMGVAFIDTMDWQDGRVFTIACSGSVSCAHWSAADSPLTYANVNFTASVA